MRPRGLEDLLHVPLGKHMHGMGTAGRWTAESCPSSNLCGGRCWQIKITETRYLRIYGWSVLNLGKLVSSPLFRSVVPKPFTAYMNFLKLWVCTMSNNFPYGILNPIGKRVIYLVLTGFYRWKPAGCKNSIVGDKSNPDKSLYWITPHWKMLPQLNDLENN